MRWPSVKPDSSYFGALGWCSTSDDMLEETEAAMFSRVKSLEPGYLVNIGPVIDASGDLIMTRRANPPQTPHNNSHTSHNTYYTKNKLKVSRQTEEKDATTTQHDSSIEIDAAYALQSDIDANSSSPPSSGTIPQKTAKKTPLLLMHGFGVGAGLWCMNIDALAKDRTVYAIDLLGFGRSSRPTFSKDPYEVEDQFVRSMEAWRHVMGIEKFYLMGHSFGGYLSTLYAMKHPQRVEHLILVDPWGFPGRPAGYSLPFYAKPVEIGAACILPFFALRAAGPFGYLYLRLMPPFNTQNLNIENAEKTVTDYFYHLNCKNPSGERAFHCLMSGIAWARLPMLDRMEKLRKEVPMTMLYGEKSWIWKSSGSKMQTLRPDSYVDVQVVAGAGHAIGSEQPKIFNAIVGRVLRSVDDGSTPSNPLAPPHSSVLASDFAGGAVILQRHPGDLGCEEEKGVLQPEWGSSASMSVAEDESNEGEGQDDCELQLDGINLEQQDCSLFQSEDDCEHQNFSRCPNYQLEQQTFCDYSSNEVGANDIHHRQLCRCSKHQRDNLFKMNDANLENSNIDTRKNSSHEHSQLPEDDSGDSDSENYSNCSEEFISNQEQIEGERLQDSTLHMANLNIDVTNDETNLSKTVNQHRRLARCKYGDAKRGIFSNCEENALISGDNCECNCTTNSTDKRKYYSNNNYELPELATDGNCDVTKELVRTVLYS